VPRAYAITSSRSRIRHETTPFFKMGFFYQNTPEMGVFDFRRKQNPKKTEYILKKRDLKPGFYTRLLDDLRQNTPVNWAKMIPNGTF